jgi:hypothetical protein
MTYDLKGNLLTSAEPAIAATSGKKGVGSLFITGRQKRRWESFLDTVKGVREKDACRATRVWHTGDLAYRNKRLPTPFVFDLSPSEPGQAPSRTTEPVPAVAVKALVNNVD